MTLDLYHNILLKSNIKLNAAQEEILNLLANLNNKINLEENKKSFSITKAVLKKQQAIKGLYLYGSFGTGKSMLMNLFFDNLLIKEKYKVHFHNFMLEMHEYMHKLKKTNKNDPLLHAAKFIASKYKILYIDELEVTDIADAMIVGKLFRELINHNIILIFTSNFAPNELYKDGLQRDSFLPFIQLMEEKLDIVKLRSDYDYRKNKLKSLETRYYIYQELMDSQKFIYDSFLKLSNNSTPKNLVLNVNSHELLCPITSIDTAVFSFDQLCRSPLSVADYRAICERFDSIIVSEIPKLSSDEHNEAKRFMNLVDTIYEFDKFLICSSTVEIDSIYTQGKWSYEFKRTISRLHEMQSEAYSN
jgi:cell division protein ZapE